MAIVDIQLPDVFEEAFEMAGQSFSGGYHIRRARRALTLLMDEWGNRGLNLWTIEQNTVACVASTATYALPTDTIDTIEAVIRSTDGLTDYSIRRVAVGEYARFAKKQQTGRPTVYYVERILAPQVTLWPVPDDTYTLVHWDLTRMGSVSSGLGTDTGVPSRFRPAMTAGLAVRLARIGQRHDLLVDLIPEYEKQMTMASEEDRDRANYHIIPGIGRVT